MAGIEVKLNNYTVTGTDTTTVKNKSLEDAVKHKKADAVTALKTVEPSVDAAEITLNAAGEVVIKSKPFAAAVTALKAGASPADDGTNTGCGVGC